MLERLYDMRIEGLHLPGPIRFTVPALKLEASLHPGVPHRLAVRIEHSAPLSGVGRADRFADELYQRLLLRFAASIVLAGGVRAAETTIDDTSSPAVVGLPTSGNAADAAATGAPPLVAVIPQADIDALQHEVQIRVVVPQLATSAQLYTAIEMFVVGLQSANKVVRFIVLYSALSLAALFRWHTGTQAKVDSLLLTSSPQLPVSQSPQGRSETIYTRLRNNLIHAEERGCDPAAAIRDIESAVEDFQRDVSCVLLGM
jgi:hypothetical protein